VSPDSDRLLTETTIWLARLERGLQGQDGVQLRHWLQVPAQRDAIVDAAQLYHGPDIVAILAAMVPVGFGTPVPKIRRRLTAFHVFIAVALGMVVAAGPLFAYFHPYPVLRDPRYRPSDPPLPWGAEAYSTKVGETRTFSLADGSTLSLNSHTRVGVLFGVGSRLATVQYGEALFEIGRRRDQPFQIDAAGRHFLAPQSKFDIRVINAQTVDLTVLDGDVTVQGLPWRWPTTPDEARMFDPRVFADTVIGPMQSAFLQDSTMTRLPVTAANLHTRLSWQPEEVLYITP
jgi:transmembrane sensor